MRLFMTLRCEAMSCMSFPNSLPISWATLSAPLISITKLSARLSKCCAVTTRSLKVTFNIAYP